MYPGPYPNMMWPEPPANVYIYQVYMDRSRSLNQVRSRLRNVRSRPASHYSQYRIGFDSYYARSPSRSRSYSRDQSPSNATYALPRSYRSRSRSHHSQSISSSGSYVRRSRSRSFSEDVRPYQTRGGFTERYNNNRGTYFNPRFQNWRPNYPRQRGNYRGYYNNWRYRGRRGRPYYNRGRYSRRRFQRGSDYINYRDHRFVSTSPFRGGGFNESVELETKRMEFLNKIKVEQAAQR